MNFNLPGVNAILAWKSIPAGMKGVGGLSYFPLKQCKNGASPWATEKQN